MTSFTWTGFDSEKSYGTTNYVPGDVTCLCKGKTCQSLRAMES